MDLVWGCNRVRSRIKRKVMGTLAGEQQEHTIINSCGAVSKGTAY